MHFQTINSVDIAPGGFVGVATRTSSHGTATLAK